MRILYVNKNINLSKPIVDQLIKMGFEVDVLIESSPSVGNKFSFVHKMINIFYRLILKDKTYFLKREKRLFEKFAEKQLQMKHYDIAFFIRADMFSESLIKRVKQRSEKMVCYQWDGLGMYPRIFNYIKYFDRFLVFDSQDIKDYPDYRLLPITNFYYSDNTDLLEEDYDFFYIGVGLEERLKLIHNVEKFSEQNGKKLKAILTVPIFRSESVTPAVTLQHYSISLQENESYARRSKSIIDFKMDEHDGASFRVFECLQREQKLISNNQKLKNYDFYHPNNIFITDFEDFNGLDEFLQKPYHKIDQKIIEKYGVKNWLKYALDYGDYETIKLP
ncbi:hypothetical protein PQ459_02145 [Chryseobacterium sp. KACC 21268]|nr:hypothetical protein PQ459_02145 [Chryseobacterium sp. KACC 21268]